MTTRTNVVSDSGLYGADEAVLRLQDWFAKRAGRMAWKNPALADDLVQEMSLGTLQCAGAHTLGFYMFRAVSRARDFLRREKGQKKKAERYSQLSIPFMEDDDTPFIEGVIDLESQLSSNRHKREDAIEMYPDARASA